MPDKAKDNQLSNKPTHGVSLQATDMPKINMGQPLTHDHTKNTILLIGNYRPTLPLIHEFQRLGFRIIVGVTDAPEQGGSRSRFVSERWHHCNLGEEPERFLAEINQLLTVRDDINYVLPVSEDAVLLLHKNRETLNSAPAYVMVEPRLINLCLDKTKNLEFADQAGIKQAPFAIVSDHESLQREAENIGFPIAIRPTVALKFGSQKAMLCKNLTELKTKLPQWPKGHQKLIIQSQVSGKRHNVYFAAKQGQVFRWLETVAERTDHADGTGLAVKGRTIPLTPALKKETETLLAKMDYTGIGCAQFLVTEDNTHSFLEINPRIAGNHMLPARAGLNLGPLLLALTQKIDIEGLDQTSVKSAKPGTTYIWTYGDLGGCFKERKKGKITNKEALKWATTAIKDAIMANSHMTWIWHDPMPTLASYGQKAIKLLKFGPKLASLTNKAQRDQNETNGKRVQQ